MKIFILISFAIAFYLFKVNVMAAPILKIGDDAPTFKIGAAMTFTLNK